MATKVAQHLTLRLEDVRDLGLALLEVADAYPLLFRTETDFYPLVWTYLRGRVPSATAERSVPGGAIDFWIGGANPAALEIAVAPRHLRDKNHDTQSFPGNAGGVRLYASHNRSELKKLAAVPQSQAKRRFLLLLDFTDSHQSDRLLKGYRDALPQNAGHNPVRVIYIARDPTKRCDFQVGGKRKGRRAAV